MLITAVGEDRTYDGSTLAAVSLSDNRIDGDDLSIDFGSARFPHAAEGRNRRIDVLSIEVNGADAGNYVWNLSAQATADIFAVDVPLASAAILPEIVQSEVSLSQDYLLIDRGIRLPAGLESDATQE